ncbi:hypothetical protein BJ085DRAFT_18905 [Dimargaris cristalligena]|uniref:UBR-type domain-containing protein n=1 Tax=Dimargaris cristalligena TaxID=215637 RepID=A0A4P9ZWW4_9FUNG|nr:hypothetical protein BJ085DRAFT_18905 [Dimargaris cristalligena]|eukprot:RKP37471.1 hypothetical protein BJ085DRAFT_18905 [Dimargaris cristalligena]
MAHSDSTLTAADFIATQTQLEKEAEEVLPGKFDACTFDLGYIHQPVYVCLTCTGLHLASTAGICYACSIACHSSHEVIELFNKRHFRCDCGTRRMVGAGPNATERACQLQPKADIINTENTYSHNFLGRYCWCNSLYDPDDEDRVMFQCAVCTDWYHSTCIGKMPENADFDEFVCARCTDRHADILKRIRPSKQVTLGVVNRATHKVETLLDPPTEVETGSLATGVNEQSSPGEKDPLTSIDADNDNDNDNDNDGSQAADRRPHKRVPLVLFGRDDWRRTSICHCSTCYPLLQAAGLTFILDDDAPYEPEKDTDSSVSLFDSGMRALATMGQSETIDGIIAYNRLRDELKSYLAPFASSGQVVTEADIRRFFEVSPPKIVYLNQAYLRL